MAEVVGQTVAEQGARGQVKSLARNTLVQMWRRDGTDVWALIHVEVQGQLDRDVARRMFVSYYCIFDRYERPLLSVAILGDEKED